MKILIIKQNVLPEEVETDNIGKTIVDYLGEDHKILNYGEYMLWKGSDDEAYIHNPLKNDNHGIVYIGGGEYCTDTFNRAIYAVGSSNMIGGMICFTTFICCNMTKDGIYVGLSDKEIKAVIEAAKSIDIAPESLVINDLEYLDNSTETIYDYHDDKIYITKNVFQEIKNDFIIRDLLSVRSFLAREYYGRRHFLRDYIKRDHRSSPSECQESYTWQDEANASIYAARFAPGLDQRDRALLYQDAVYCAYVYSQTFRLDEHMKSVIFGDGTATPEDIPVDYVSLKEAKNND